MYLLALTGGIASGKSTVARRLASHGAVIVDADLIARQVVEPGTPGLAAIAERFGAGVIAADGTLDRPALGAIVFSDAEARLALNGITHPAVVAESQRQFAAAAETDAHAVVVYDVPLLAEGRGSAEFREVVVVHAPAEARIRRLVELRGMGEQEARNRVSSQASDADRLALADVVIDSGGTLEHTHEQVDALWERLRTLA